MILDIMQLKVWHQLNVNPIEYDCCLVVNGILLLLLLLCLLLYCNIYLWIYLKIYVLYRSLNRPSWTPKFSHQRVHQWRNMVLGRVWWQCGAQLIQMLNACLLVLISLIDKQQRRVSTLLFWIFVSLHINKQKNHHIEELLW